MTISMKFVVALVLTLALAVKGKKTRRPTRGQIEKTVQNKAPSRALHHDDDYYGKGGYRSGYKSGKKGKKSGARFPEIDPNPCGCAPGQFFDFLSWGDSGCDGGACVDCTEVYDTFGADATYLVPAPYFCDFFETSTLTTMDGNVTVFLPFGGRQDCEEKCFLAIENIDGNGCDPHFEFFNYDDFEFNFEFGGSCEQCENYANAEVCATEGLTRAGEVECLERCFGIY